MPLRCHAAAAAPPLFADTPYADAAAAPPLFFCCFSLLMLMAPLTLIFALSMIFAIILLRERGAAPYARYYAASRAATTR